MDGRCSFIFPNNAVGISSDVNNDTTGSRPAKATYAKVKATTTCSLSIINARQPV